MLRWKSLIASRLTKGVRRQGRVAQGRAVQGPRRLAAELLEDRRVLAAVTVGNALDVVNGDTSSITALIGNAGGDGISLREAILAANATPGADNIGFIPGLTGQTIELTTGTELAITEALTIDASALATNIIVDANQLSRIFNITATLGDFNISGLTLTGGRTVGSNSGVETTFSGGAIRSASEGTLTISDVTITGNSTLGNNADGGGIQSVGVLSIANSTISNNTTAGTTSGGGGISAINLTLNNSTVSGNSTAGQNSLGGGIYALNASVFNSTVSGNQTQGTNSVGGGISAPSVILNSSTISGNSTTGTGAHGAGVFTQEGINAFHSTIANNQSQNGVGGGFYASTNVVLSHTIIAGNTATGGNADLKAVGTTTISYSLVGSTAGTGITNVSGTGNLLDMSAVLGPLANNGGATFTHALLSGSPAIDTGDPTAVAGVGSIPSFDQRGSGFARVLDGDGSGSARIDMGAFEAPVGTATPKNITLDSSLNLVIADQVVGGTNNDFELAIDGANLVVRDSSQLLTTDVAGSSGNGTNEVRIPIAAIAGNGVIVNGLAGNDTLTVLSAVTAAGLAVSFDGGAGSDALAVVGTGAEDAVYTPDATTPGNGIVTVDGQAITFASLAPVDISGMANATLNLPSADDVLTIQEGVDFASGGTNPALRVSGTSGGVAIEAAAFWNNTNLVIDTTVGTDGNDTITVTSAANAHLNQNFTMQTGTGTDAVAVNGNITTANSVAILSENITLGATITAPTSVTLDAGGGAITDSTANTISKIETATLSLLASTGIGTSTAAIETTTPQLIVTNVTSGAVNIVNTGALTLNQLTAGGSATITASSPLTINGNVTVGGDSTFTSTDSAAAGDDLTIASGVTIDANGNNLTFNAGDNFIFAAGATITNAGNVVANADVTDADAPDVGAMISILGTITATQLTVNGGDDEDTFIVAPSVDTPMQINGGAPSNAPGDRLILQLSGIADAIVPSVPPTNGTITFTASRKTIAFNSIEALLAGTLVVDNLEDEDDGNFAVGDFSLREAINFANGNSGTDTIVFAAALDGQTIPLTLGELAITDDLTIDASGLANGITIDGAGNGDSRLLNIENLAADLTVTINGLTLTGANFTGNGGAIFSSETLTVRNTEIAGNTAAQGGGLYVTGPTTFVNSTLADNSATDSGGGIVSDTALDVPVVIINSTISGNSAVNVGGGVFNFEGLTQILFSTITNNAAAVGGGSGVFSSGDVDASTEVHSTIIAGNVSSDVDTTVPNTFVSQGYNLIGSGSALVEFTEPGDQTLVADPMLFDLAENGGPTRTHLARPGSPAIDLGDPTDFAGIDGVPEFDQRGLPFTRVRDGDGNAVSRIDIGATEAENQLNGPQVTGVSVSDNTNSTNVFSPIGPTVTARTLTISFRDVPPRSNVGDAPALDFAFAANPALYSLVGDATGIVPITSVQVIPDPIVVGQPATASVVLTFARPLADDRYTLTVSDQLRDTEGNRLDGESNASQPVNPTFPSGDGVPGGNFVARFTIDSMPEFGIYAGGQVFIDGNGNFVFDPNTTDPTNRDLAFLLGNSTDGILAGNFSPEGSATTDGFDKLAVYGRSGSQWRWQIDVDNDGIPDIVQIDPLGINGIPVAGNFDGNAANGDEVGVFTGTTWYFDTDHDYLLNADSAVTIPNMIGYPVVGDFNGDGLDDLATYSPANGANRFSIALATAANTWSTTLLTARVGTPENPNGFAGVRERPVAGDMNGDGIDDLGLYLPDGAILAPGQQGQWYFLMSADDPNTIAVEGTIADRFTAGNGFVSFNTSPFGNDLFAQFGNSYSLPLVGNFDPPVVVSAAAAPTPTTTPTPVSVAVATTFVIPLKTTSAPTTSANKAEESTPSDSTPIVVNIPTKVPATVVETTLAVPATPPTERFTKLLARRAQTTVVAEIIEPVIEASVVVPVAEVVTPSAQQPLTAPPSRFNRLTQRQNALSEATPVVPPVVEVVDEPVSPPVAEATPEMVATEPVSTPQISEPLTPAIVEEVAPSVIETPVEVVVEVTPVVIETIEPEPPVSEISEAVVSEFTPEASKPETIIDPVVVEVSTPATVEVETPTPRFSRLVNRWGRTGTSSTPSVPAVTEPSEVVITTSPQSVVVTATAAILPSKQVGVQSVPAVAPPSVTSSLASVEIEVVASSAAESVPSTAALQSVPVFAFSYVREAELATSIVADDFVATTTFDLAIQDDAFAAYVPQAEEVATTLARPFAETHDDAEDESMAELQIAWQF